MGTDSDRKELPLTRIAIERATQQERLSYGALIAELRKAKKLTQEDLQHRSEVTTRTIRNIESGERAGQADKLIRLFIALEVDLDGSRRAEVEQYLAMLGPVIHDIHPDYRFAAVAGVIPVLSDAVREHPNVGGRYDHQDLPTLDARRERRLRDEATGMAAERGEIEIEQPDGEIEQPDGE